MSLSSPLKSALGGLLAAAAAMGVGRFVFTPILPPMSHALGLTTAQAGWIASANYVGYLLGALGASHAQVSRRPRQWMIAALTVSALSTLAMGLSQDLAAFLILRLVGGVASAIVLVCASALVLRQVVEAGRPGLSALHFAGVGIGVAGSAILVSLLNSAGVDWRGLWIASGLIALVAAAGAVLLIPPASPAPPVQAHAAKPLPGFVPLVLAYGLFGFGYVITATFLVALTRAAPAARPMEPFVWLIVGVTATPTILLWDRIGRRMGSGPAFALACLVEAVGVALSVLEPNVWGAGLAAALVGGTYMGITALGLQQARLRAVDPAKALALMTAAFGLGQIIGPLFAGQLSQLTGNLTLASLIAAGALLLAAALTARLPDKA